MNNSNLKPKIVQNNTYMYKTVQALSARHLFEPTPQCNFYRHLV